MNWKKKKKIRKWWACLHGTMLPKRLCMMIVSQSQNRSDTNFKAKTKHKKSNCGKITVFIGLRHVHFFALCVCVLCAQFLYSLSSHSVFHCTNLWYGWDHQRRCDHVAFMPSILRCAFLKEVDFDLLGIGINKRTKLKRRDEKKREKGHKAKIYWNRERTARNFVWDGKCHRAFSE